MVGFVKTVGRYLRHLKYQRTKDKHLVCIIDHTSEGFLEHKKEFKKIFKLIYETENMEYKDAISSD